MERFCETVGHNKTKRWLAYVDNFRPQLGTVTTECTQGRVHLCPKNQLGILREVRCTLIIILQKSLVH